MKLQILENIKVTLKDAIQVTRTQYEEDNPELFSDDLEPMECDCMDIPPFVAGNESEKVLTGYTPTDLDLEEATRWLEE